jgi:hypothetical protein
MSPAFLANKIFQPFSQENPHSSGVGLGLSIVRQIIETNGGKIEVSSDYNHGTKITVKVSLLRPEAMQIPLPQQHEYLSWLARLKGRKICMLHRAKVDQDIMDEPQNAEGLAKFIQALKATLTNHLKMDVVQTTKWGDNNCDLVICPEPLFDYLAFIRKQRANSKAATASVTIFVALDALEAATLQSDVRVKNKESVVEIMTQPLVHIQRYDKFLAYKTRLGPYKLAYVLNKCLDRFEHPEENVQPESSPDHLSTTDLTQTASRLPLGKESIPPFRTSSPSQMATISPPPVEMPPLLNQPHWHQTDKPVNNSSPIAEVSNNSTPAADSPAVEERVIPIRPKLTIPGTPGSVTSSILIVDDNAINRRVGLLYLHTNSSTVS